MRTNQSFRKPWVRLLLLLPMLAVATLAPAQTLNWGNAVFDYPMDSKGNTLDSSYVFQLGAFKGTFAPDDTNIGEWLNNWQVFDQADYNPLLGYFTSDVREFDSGWLEQQRLPESGGDEFRKQGGLPVDPEFRHAVGQHGMAAGAGQFLGIPGGRAGLLCQ